MNTHPSAFAGVLVAWLAIVPMAIAAEVRVIGSMISSSNGGFALKAAAILCDRPLPSPPV